MKRHILILNANTFAPLILTCLISHVSTWFLHAHNQHSYLALPASGWSWENPLLIPLSFLILMQICNFSHANFQMQIFQLLKYSGVHWLFTLLELMGSGEYLGNQKTFFVCTGSFITIVPVQNLPPSVLEDWLTPEHIGLTGKLFQKLWSTKISGIPTLWGTWFMVLVEDCPRCLGSVCCSPSSSAREPSGINGTKKWWICGPRLQL